MNIESKLLNYKKEMENLDKDVQRLKGSLDSEYNSLQKDLGIEGTPEKLQKETKIMIKKIDSQATNNNEKLEELMEEIETAYLKFEEE